MRSSSAFKLDFASQLHLDFSFANLGSVWGERALTLSSDCVHVCGFCLLFIHQGSVNTVNITCFAVLEGLFRCFIDIGKRIIGSFWVFLMWFFWLINSLTFKLVLCHFKTNLDEGGKAPNAGRRQRVNRQSEILKIKPWTPNMTAWFWLVTLPGSSYRMATTGSSCGVVTFWSAITKRVSERGLDYHTDIKRKCDGISL